MYTNGYIYKATNLETRDGIRSHCAVRHGHQTPESVPRIRKTAS